jgi:hypothetical protein
MKSVANRISRVMSGVLLLTGAMHSVSYSAEPRFEHNGRVEILDDRYHHGHFYVPRGVIVRELPAGYRPYLFHGSRFYFAGGVWYAPGPQGFVVVRPPAGLLVTTLPPFYTTVWIAGTPYYYANDVYYRWVPAMNGYEVVDPPAGADKPTEAAPQMAADDLFLYPKNGQTAEQQSVDRYECHSWSKAQTGFDPTQPGGGVPPAQNTEKREQYRRAMTACLEARGYSVK